MKHVDIFRECKALLWQFFYNLAQNEGTSVQVSPLLAVHPPARSLQSIVSNEGIEQLAALLPRTRSELLQVDSMTAAKLQLYGAQLNEVLRPFWERVDRREQEAIEAAVAQY